MPPETPDTIGNSETAERSSEIPFTVELSRLQEVVGPAKEPLPEQVSEKDLRKMEIAILEDSSYESFNELFRRNELLYRRSALQRLAVFEQTKDPSEESTTELVVANKAAVYHKYFQRTINHMLGVLREYESLRLVTPHVPESIIRDEQKMKLYIAELQSTLRERIAFANVLMINAQIAQGLDVARLSKLRERYMAQITSEATRNALNGNTSEQWKRGNALNQRIIDLLSGNHGLQGLDNGFVPQRVYIDLLKYRYRSLLERQKEIVSDPKGVRVNTEIELLEAKLTMSQDGTGAFTKADKERLESLRSQVQDRNAELDRLTVERNATLQELIGLTGQFAEYQLEQAELSTIQNQFGEHVDFTGATQPRADTTPSFVREAMSENMEIRSNFHMDRMDSMMRNMEENVLDPGWNEAIEDTWNKNGREAVRKVAHKISEIITIPLPGMGGIRKAAQDSLTESLDESLGWPPGKDTWEELTPKEREKVKERSKSILDAIANFDRSTIEQTRETIAVVKAMPDASSFVGEEVVEPLPTERITLENMDRMIKEHGGATVYFMLFEQMEGDWGNAETGTGFMGEYKKFLEAVNTNIDVKIDVSKAMIELSSSYAGLTKDMLIAALIILGAGILTGVAAARMLSKATGGSLRLVSGSMRQLAKLRHLRPPQALTRLRYLKQERQLVQAIRNSRLGRTASSLAVFKNTRFSRVLGRMGKGTGTVLRAIGPLAVAASVGYEYSVHSNRKTLVEGNAELQDEYSSQQNTTILEGLGVGSTLLLSLNPMLVLSSPVIWAKRAVSDRRSEARANWKRNAVDWQAEFSSAQMKQKLLDIAPGTEVETEGGAYPTRIGSWFYSDEEYEKIFPEIASGNKGARAQVYLAYFAENLMAAESMSKEEQATIVRLKYRYIHMRTNGDMQRVTAESLEQADAYAYLVTMYKDMKSKGKPTLLSYFDEKGERQWVDLRKLDGSNQEVAAVVGEYFYHVKPQEEVILFNYLGEQVKNEHSPLIRDRLEKQSVKQVRQVILISLLHDIHEAERAIQAVDWPGVDFYVSDGNTDTQNLVRWYLRFQLNKKIKATVPKLLSGALTIEEYKVFKSALRAILQQPLAVEHGKSSVAYRKEAERYVGGAGNSKKGKQNIEKAEEYSGNSLYEMLQ